MNSNNAKTKSELLLTGDDFGHVKLWRYPCVKNTALHKTYRGHSSHVTNVAFSTDTKLCFSTGGRDNCLFQWKTDYSELDDQEDSSSASNLFVGSTENYQEEDDDQDGLLFGIDSLHPSGGDEFMAVKPWLGAIVEPSDYKTENISSFSEEKLCQELLDRGLSERGSLADKRSRLEVALHREHHSPPNEELELDFVFGYRSSDVRNNLFYDSEGSIVYHAAAVGIVYVPSQHTQRFNLEHTDDIMCLAMHPSGHTVATAECGKKPAIVVWDVFSGNTLLTI